MRQPILFAGALTCTSLSLFSYECECECISRIQVGGNYTYAHLASPDVASTQGSLGGFQILYEYRPPCELYGGAEFKYRKGSTDRGSFERDLVDIHIQARLGYTLITCDETLWISLFSGFGYRHIEQKMSTDSDTVTFNYNEFYVPVGFVLEYECDCCLNVGLDFQWMPQIYPTVTITPLDGARWILQNERANFYVALPFMITLTEDRALFLTIAPFFEAWHDGRTTAESSSGLALDVSKNTYLFTGVNVNLGYWF